MNKFFLQQPFDFEIPRRVYAKRIDGDGSRYLLYDAVDACWLDAELSRRGGQINPVDWLSMVEKAPVYAVEINSRDGKPGPALDWLRSPVRPRERWVSIDLKEDQSGAAEVYAASIGPAKRARISVKRLSRQVQNVLKTATDLSRFIAPTSIIKSRLPGAAIAQIVVLDVGQGFASALVDRSGKIVAYVDLGAGVLSDTRTRPPSMKGLCFCHDPVVLLSHWHYDHFESANVYPAAQKLTWIAPLQTIGPGPQSAMASAIAGSGSLMVWSGGRAVGRGVVNVERCTGPSGNSNRTGLAVWVDGPGTADPILLPGDAGYADIPGLIKGRSISSLAASHHGGTATGRPPSDPGLSTTKLAMSYGHGNSYGHPLPASVRKLTKAKWTLGAFPGTAVDERRTEVRPGGVGGSGLGHIGLQWPSAATTSISCFCGSTVSPTQ